MLIRNRKQKIYSIELLSLEKNLKDQQVQL